MAPYPGPYGTRRPGDAAPGGFVGWTLHGSCTPATATRAWPPRCIRVPQAGEPRGQVSRMGTAAARRDGSPGDRKEISRAAAGPSTSKGIRLAVVFVAA